MEPITVGGMTTEILVGIVSGLLTDAMEAASVHIRSRGKASKEVGDRIRYRIEEDSSLKELFGQAAKWIATSPPLQGDVSQARVKEFLSSPEAEAIVRQIYTTKLGELGHDSVESIGRLITESLALYLGEPDSTKVRESADLLFKGLLQACDRALAAGVDVGMLPAHEARSAFRHLMVMEELTAVRNSLEFLTSQTKPAIDEILKFEETYRN